MKVPIFMSEGTYPQRGLWILFYYLGKRENDFTILAGREYETTGSTDTVLIVIWFAALNIMLV